MGGGTIDLLSSVGVTIFLFEASRAKYLLSKQHYLGFSSTQKKCVFRQKMDAKTDMLCIPGHVMTEST